MTMSGGACAVNRRAARPPSVGRRKIKEPLRKESMLFAFSAKGHAGADTRCCQRPHPARWTGAKLKFQRSGRSELRCRCGASQGTKKSSKISALAPLAGCAWQLPDSRLRQIAEETASTD